MVEWCNKDGLKALGLVELARAKSVKMVIGTLEVTQLEAPAKLDIVPRIEPSLSL
ncbi:MAG: hypothetical protein WCJ35_15845 [Planctomycetota bacterium]